MYSGHFSLFPLMALQTGWTAKPLQKKVWKLKFDSLHLSCYGMIIVMFSIIRQCIYSSFKWYPICYDSSVMKCNLYQIKGRGQKWSAVRSSFFEECIGLLCWHWGTIPVLTPAFCNFSLLTLPLILKYYSLHGDIIKTNMVPF